MNIMPGRESATDLIERPSGVDLGGASNVLVLTESLDDAARESYYRTLLPEDPSSVDVLAVDYRRTPEEYLEEWRRYVDDQPRRCGIVCVDGSARSSGDGSEVGPGAVATVESPTDLTGLGITVGNYLESNGGSDTIVTFDSLTMLLQYVERERAFRFLGVLGNRVEEADAVAHYHMDPKAHDDQEMATLSSLFDAVARFEGDGWQIRRR